HVQLGAEARARSANEVALGHLARAEHALEALAGPRLLAEARHRAATAALESGKADEAISHLQSALLIAERIGDDTARARTLVSLAEAQVHKGAYSLAEQALVEAERLTTVTPDSAQSARIELARPAHDPGRARARGPGAAGARESAADYSPSSASRRGSSKNRAVIAPNTTPPTWAM